jgi:hypothetical protein
MMRMMLQRMLRAERRTVPRIMKNGQLKRKIVFGERLKKNLDNSRENKEEHTKERKKYEGGYVRAPCSSFTTGEPSVLMLQFQVFNYSDIRVFQQSGRGNGRSTSSLFLSSCEAPVLMLHLLQIFHLSSGKVATFVFVVHPLLLILSFSK